MKVFVAGATGVLGRALVSQLVASLIWHVDNRELFFWTIMTSMAMIVLVATTVAFVVSLIQGSSMDAAHLAIGALGGLTLVQVAASPTARGLVSYQWP